MFENARMKPRRARGLTAVVLVFALFGATLIVETAVPMQEAPRPNLAPAAVKQTTAH